MQYTSSSLQSGTKFCDTCAEMTSTNESLIIENMNLKRRNKILVTVNRTLRDKVTSLQQSTDDLMRALYEQDQQELTTLADVVASEESA